MDRGRHVVSIVILSAVVHELDIRAYGGCFDAQELEGRGGLASACCFDRGDGEIGATVVGDKLPAGARVALAPDAAGQVELDRVVDLQAEVQVVGALVGELQNIWPLLFLGEGRGCEDSSESDSELFHCVLVICFFVY